MNSAHGPFGLTGRTALVTGASRGIGQSIAIGLARAGAGIVALARSAEGLGSTKEQVEALGQPCHTIQASVSTISAIKAAYSEIQARDLRPDILINNAGIESVCPSTDVTEELWDKIVDTNLKGAFFVAQQFAKPLIAARQTGSVINLGSLTSAVGVPTATPYTSSKSGILGMTRALASEWSPHGVRVNAIGPGYFRTELTEEFYRNDAWREQMIAKIPMGRFGNLDDLTGVSVFLASDASAYVTGQIVYVDGGYLASI